MRLAQTQRNPQTAGRRPKLLLHFACATFLLLTGFALAGQAVTRDASFSAVSQQRADLLGQLKEERVEVADNGLRHRLVDTRRHHAGAGAEEEALRRLQGRIGLRHKRIV